MGMTFLPLLLLGLSGPTEITETPMHNEVTGKRGAQKAHAEHQDEANPELPYDGWGPVVNGVRMQLFAVRKEYVVREDVDLTLLVQNVMDREIVLPGLSLMPTLANGESHPYGDRHPFNTMISFRIPNTELHILWQRQVPTVFEVRPLRLKAREVHVATIQVRTRPQLERDIQVQRKTRRGRDNGGGLSRHTARLAGSASPRRYILKARFHPEGLADVQPATIRKTRSTDDWQGKLLESNSTELVLVARKRRLIEKEQDER